MQDHELKIQHLIILSALFVTLLGSLLLLDHMNDITQFTGSTTVIIPEQDIVTQENSIAEKNEEDTLIRIATKANLSDS